jgi:hypothetical protein
MSAHETGCTQLIKVKGLHQAFFVFFFCFPVFLAVPADTKIFNKTKGFGVSQHLLPGYHMSEEALGLAATWYDLVWTPSKVCIVEGTCTFVVTIH